MKKTIKFIEPTTPKDRALLTAIRAFAIISYGGTLSAKEASLFIEICSLALPMKYRLTRETWQRIAEQVKQSLTLNDSRN